MKWLTSHMIGHMTYLEVVGAAIGCTEGEYVIFFNIVMNWVCQTERET